MFVHGGWRALQQSQKIFLVSKVALLMTRSSSQDERLSQLQKRGFEVFTEGHCWGRARGRERAVPGRTELILQLSGCWGVLPGRKEELLTLYTYGSCYILDLSPSHPSHPPPLSTDTMLHIFHKPISPCTQPPTPSSPSLQLCLPHHPLITHPSSHSIISHLHFLRAGACLTLLRGALQDSAGIW